MYKKFIFSLILCIFTSLTISHSVFASTKTVQGIPARVLDDDGEMILFELQDKNGNQIEYIAAAWMFNGTNEAALNCLERAADKDHMVEVSGQWDVQVDGNVGFKVDTLKCRSLQPTYIIDMWGQKRSIEQYALDNDFINSVKNKNIDDAKKFLMQGADVNAYDDFGNRSIFLAIRNNDVDMVQLLIDNNVNLETATMQHNFFSLIEIAASRGYYEILNILLNHTTDRYYISKALLASSKNNHLKCANLLLEKYIGISNDKKYFGNIFLYAIAANNKTIVDIMLEKGVDINFESEHQENGLVIASMFNRPEMVKYFIDKGIKINYEICKKAILGNINNPNHNILNTLFSQNISFSQDDINSFFRAVVSYGDVPSLGIILNHGADINMVTNDNSTALHLSAYYGNTKITEYLVNYTNIDINAQDKTLSTALIYATKEKYYDIIKCLLENKASINITDRDDLTALDYAFSYIYSPEKGNYPIIELLLDNGGKCNEKNPFINAIKRIDLVEFLLKKYFDKSQIELAMINAAEEHTYDTISLFLKSGADINAQDENGETAIMKASRHNDPYMVKFLIENNANIFIKNKEGQLAMDVIGKVGNRITKSEDSEKVKNLLEDAKNSQINPLDIDEDSKYKTESQDIDQNIVHDLSVPQEKSIPSSINIHKEISNLQNTIPDKSIDNDENSSQEKISSPSQEKASGNNHASSADNSPENFAEDVQLLPKQAEPERAFHNTSDTSLSTTSTQSQAQEQVPSPQPSLEGTWRGQLITAYGKTGVTLIVKETQGKSSCVLTFYPLKENPGAGSGQYEMSMSFDEKSCEYTLRGTRWLKNPKRRAFMHLRGKREGSVFSGIVFTDIPTQEWTFLLEKSPF